VTLSLRSEFVTSELISGYPDIPWKETYMNTAGENLRQGWFPRSGLQLISRSQGLGKSSSFDRHDDLTVLVINDHPDQLELMDVVLRNCGYRVLTTTDGGEGFNTARREHPDLIVSDVSMPRMSGIELCRLVRSDPVLQTTPVLLVSAIRKDSDSVVEGLRAGADDYLEAPYDPMKLVTKVAQLIERKQAEVEIREGEELFRAAAEMELRRSEERYRDLVENARDVIYTHDLAGNYTSINKVAEQLIGYTQEEILTMNLFEIVAPEYHEKARQLIDTTLAGEGETTHDLEILSKGGSRVAFEVNARLIYQSGVPIGVQGIARDVTERKHLEAQLRQSQKLEAVGQLAGGVAHDFNNLLTVILGYSEMLLRRPNIDDPVYRSLEEIKKAGERASSLTRQLLAFSRKQVLQPKVIDLNSVVAEMLKLLLRLIGEDLELVTDLKPSPARIKADPGQIEQVLVNLAVNARDAMPRGGKLIIKTENVVVDDEPHLMLTVSDTGHGMDAETQAHVFEPFFTTKPAGEGSGLGLATVYGIVKQSGGNIWLSSERGKGTTFRICLPRVDDVAVDPEIDAGKQPIPRGTETLLLVEDEEQVRRIITEVLERQGYKVLAALNGEEALKIAQDEQIEIHLLLTDVVMPQMGGRELAETLSKSRPQLKVLYMSGYTDDAIVRHGLMEETLNFIQKPFDSVMVARKVREVLDSPSATE